MSRDWYINGESLVTVKGGEHLSGILNPVVELALARGPVTISPHFSHKEIHVDDFGPECPVEVLWMIGWLDVKMELIHFDRSILDYCMGEAMGGALPITQAGGVINPCGLPLGNGLPVFASGNHYLSVNVLSPVERVPWRFPTSYIPFNPFEFPLGTEKSVVNMTFRAIPYQSIYRSGGSMLSGGILVDGIIYTPGEIQSSGCLLFDHNQDN